jgi:hypothetical protein
MIGTASHCLAAPIVAVCLLILAPTVHADPLTDAKRALDQASRDLRNANDTVTQANTAFNQALASVSRYNQNLTNATAAFGRAENALSGAQNALNVAHGVLTQATNELSRARADFTNAQQKLTVAEGLMNALLDANLTLYDMQWSVSVEYNALTGSFTSWATFPDGLKVTSSALAEALHGGVPLPEIEPAEALGTALGFKLDKNCTFDTEVASIYQNAGAGASVYVSTRGLSELLSPEHAADASIKAVLSGGSTLEGALDEVARACLSEVNAVRAFLQQVAPTEADKLFGNVMQAIISGTKFESPTVSIHPFTAKMDYTVEVAGGAIALLKYLPNLQKDVDKLHATFSFPRAGFAVIVKSSPVPTRTALHSAIGTVHAIDPNVLRSALSEGSVQLLQVALTADADPMTVVSSAIETALKNLDLSTIPIDPAFPYCLDLKGTAVGTALDRLLKNLVIGKQGAATISRFNINFHSGQVSAVVDLRAKDSSSLRDALKLVEKVTTDIDDASLRAWKTATNDLEAVRQQVDVITNRVADASTVVNTRANAMIAAQNAANRAKLVRDRAQGLLNDAEAMENHRAQDLRNARKAVVQVQSRINSLQRLIRQLTPRIPPITIPRPHPFPRPHF